MGPKAGAIDDNHRNRPFITSTMPALKNTFHVFERSQIIRRREHMGKATLQVVGNLPMLSIMSQKLKEIKIYTRTTIHNITSCILHVAMYITTDRVITSRRFTYKCFFLCRHYVSSLWYTISTYFLLSLYLFSSLLYSAWSNDKVILWIFYYKNDKCKRCD